MLGLLNDPTENTMAYIPGISDKLIESKKIIENICYNNASNYFKGN